MKIAAYDTRQAQAAFIYQAAPVAKEHQENTAATLEISNAAQDARPAGGNPLDKNSVKEAAKKQSSEIKDDSGRLTRRLVAAAYQSEVRTIVSEAYKNLGELLKAAMTAEGSEAKKAFAAIKRLHKLIRRATRKIGDLDKEDSLRAERKRAEKKQQIVRAQALKTELERRLTERKMREKKYLRDAAEPKDDERDERGMTRAELEAKVAALAAMMAQLTQTSVAAAAAPEAVTAETASSEATTPAEGGGEAVTVDGGEMPGGE